MQDHGWIFDLDGTLVDTVDLHADAFVRAFAERGLWAPRNAVADRIGKGGDRLVAELAPGLPSSESKALRERHGEIVREEARRRGVRVHDGARELIEALRRRGLRTALATASRQDDLEVVLGAAGLPLDELLDVVVSSAHVRRTKPAPDAVEAALEALGLPPERCVLVGDSAWDVQTGHRAGVRVVAVATGAHDLRRLQGAGADHSFRDLRELLAHLDHVLEACFGERARAGAAR